MPNLARIAVAAERHLGPIVSPMLHRRPDHALREGAIGSEDERRARQSWWGEDRRWYPGGTPPRRRNRITPLVDGDAFFRCLYDALLAARNYVYIAAWCLTPHVPLLRDTREQLTDTRLVDVLSCTAARVPVRILLWGGALAVIQPTRGAVERTVEALRREGQGDLRVGIDRTARFTHCHHQKAIVVDGQQAFVGGMDLTTFAGDRWDVNDHDMRAGVNWHDVEALIEGEAVGDVEQNFRQRWSGATGDRSLPHCDAHIDPSWNTPAQIVRTIPRSTYGFAPRGEYGIHHAYVEAIRAARRFIYIESQYLWSPTIIDALEEAIQRERGEPFRVVIVLPARATSGKWDNDKHVEAIRSFDGGRGNADVYSLYASGPLSGVRGFGYRPTYVHAKVAIIDDEWLTIGSANLNNRGLITDSEINVSVTDPAVAKALRCRLWAEHLGVREDDIASADPIAMIDGAWKQHARDNADIIRRGDRPLISQVHRYLPGRMPGAWLLDEAEDLTFEH
jgi:phosphatidylserine/phosphatidylglycerophosphate/cardiolipin synthase-like enzyme